MRRGIRPARCQRCKAPLERSAGPRGVTARIERGQEDGPPIVDDRGQVLAVGRYGTDKAGYAEMRGRGAVAVTLDLEGIHAPAKVHGERQDVHEQDDHHDCPGYRCSPRALLPLLHKPVKQDDHHEHAEHQPPPWALLELVPEPVSAALPFNHIPVTVLGLLATGDDEPSPPNEEAGQALEKDEQQQETFASL